MRRTLLLLGVLLLAACSGGGSGGGSADTLTRRQRDSLLSTMPIPGAGAVGKALRAADSARARAERHDTMLR